MRCFGVVLSSVVSFFALESMRHIIRVIVHNYKTMLPARQDQIIAIIVLSRFAAENTAFRFFLEDIFHAPGRP